MSKDLYRQSETVTIKRSEISFAPYNPKKHSQSQIDEIKRNFKRVGFLGGIIWNEQTGNLVDGHKRVQTLDAIHKYDGTADTDYDIKIEKISLDRTAEIEQNIFQTRSRTDLDDELMRSIVPDINFQNAGLDEYDLNMYGIDLEPFIPEDDFSVINEPIAKSAEQKKEAVKAVKQEIKEKAEEKVRNMESYITLSFSSYEAKEAFMLRFGYDKNSKFIKGETFSQQIERID
ncbi:ParB N-terminal domain-containing protein [Pedobacter sp.]